jgi:hypothetical protein
MALNTGYSEVYQYDPYLGFKEISCCEFTQLQAAGTESGRSREIISTVRSQAH